MIERKGDAVPLKPRFSSPHLPSNGSGRKAGGLFGGLPYAVLSFAICPGPPSGGGDGCEMGEEHRHFALSGLENQPSALFNFLFVCGHFRLHALR